MKKINKMTIDKKTIYFSADFVEFEINGYQFAGEFYEDENGFCQFTLSDNDSDPEAVEIYEREWENINEQLTLIYFGEETQNDRNL